MTSTLPPLVQALSGAVGSASASTLTYPLDLITTRLQLDSSEKAKRRGGVKGGLRLLLLIVYGSKRKQRPGLGWRALYDGLQSDLFATMLSNFFYFYFYSFLRTMSTHGLEASITLPALRRVLRLQEGKSKNKHHQPSLLEDILLGFVAGVASRAVSTPLNIITLRLQEERADEEDDDESGSDSGSERALSPSLSETAEGVQSPSPKKKKEDMGILGIARMIYEEEGIRGFWKGFGTSALLSINPSITLAFFQLFRKAVVYSRRVPPNGHVNENLKPIEAFFVGAIANSIASSILYPLILAKKRLQSGAGTSPNATLLDVLRDAYQGKYDPHSASPISEDRLQTSRPAARRAKSSRYGKGLQEAGRMEGIEGLYQGLQMQILKGFFNQGTTFLVKGRIELLVVAAYLRRRAVAS
ncbi:hypothetical protein D9611_003753 [Ephemerocybe angulata]|uniref:Mitochondrial carrier protein n=1 Tax=Ephemerocybe angulata TaxID=980116 RepID=A0A8H5B5Z0_9AGAR|nr:hypothetical protein D9611_003753 [Tulosesus angulatus]